MRGKFAQEIIPIEAVQVAEDERGNPVKRLVRFDRDEGVRPNITMEALAKRPTVFKKNGTVIPGNASQMSDGAAFVVLMERERTFSGGLCVDVAGVFFAIRPSRELDSFLKMQQLRCAGQQDGPVKTLQGQMNVGTDVSGRNQIHKEAMADAGDLFIAGCCNLRYTEANTAKRRAVPRCCIMNVLN